MYAKNDAERRTSIFLRTAVVAPPSVHTEPKSLFSRVSLDSCLLLLHLFPSDSAVARKFTVESVDVKDV